MNERRRNARLVTIAAVAFLLFNYPLLAVFDVEVTVLGVPLVWLYVFGAWAGVVAAVGAVARER